MSVNQEEEQEVRVPTSKRSRDLPVGSTMRRPDRTI